MKQTPSLLTEAPTAGSCWHLCKEEEGGKPQPPPSGLIKKLHNYLRFSENKHKFYKLYYHGNKSLSEATALSCDSPGSRVHLW